MSHRFISAFLYPMSNARQVALWLMGVVGATILISTGCGDSDAHSDTTTSTGFASEVEIAPSDSVIVSDRTLKTNDGGVFKYPSRIIIIRINLSHSTKLNPKIPGRSSKKRGNARNPANQI